MRKRSVVHAMREVMSGRRAKFGIRHINYAVALIHLGVVYKQQGNYAEALSSTLAKNLPVHRAREMWNMGSFSTIS